MTFNRMMILLIMISLIGTVVQAGEQTTINNLPMIILGLHNLYPNPAIAGETVELRLNIENLGDVAQDVVLRVQPQYPFQSLSGYDLVSDVGTMDAHQGGDIAKIAKFNLKIDKDASAGTYLLKVLEYQKGYEDQGITYTIPVDIKARESAEIISIDKTELIPGQESDMKFTINNVGNAPLRDLTFSWSNSDKVVLPVGGDNTKYIRYLDQGKSVDLQYKVIADPSANPGLYSLSLNLKYLDTINGTEKTVTTTAGVYVGGGTDFDVAFAQSSNSQTSFTVANIGSNTAYSVSVVVPQQPGWQLTGPDTVILGNLNKGDYTVASYALQAPGSSSNASTARTGRRTTPGTATDTAATAPSPRMFNNTAANTIKIQVAYTDTKGSRQIVEKTVKLSSQDVASGQTSKLTTATQTSFFGTYQWYIVAAVVLVLAYMGFKRWKKAKAAATDRKKK
jgi:hypothetical protein